MPSSYLTFNRDQWAALKNTVPLILTESDLLRLQGINEAISLAEVSEIYLAVSRLLNFYISAHAQRQNILEQFLGTKRQNTPYIIGIAGSVAVGKSTTARVLQALLSQWPDHRRVELVTTDGFLYPNAILKSRGLMNKKGFPESYDVHRLINFISDVRSGIPNVLAPVYSHLIYDIVPGKYQKIQQPDIIILEGLNVLQSGQDYPDAPHPIFVSDFLDFSIYVDAPTNLLENWYLERFLKFRASAFTDPNAYFHHYARLEEKEAIKIATHIWKNINHVNLEKNILPTRERANLILTKGKDHKVSLVRLRK